VKGDKVPDTDTIARYCPFGRLSESGRPTKAAFALTDSDRADDNPHLSVNWFEYFRNKSREEQVNEVRAILAKKLSRVGGQAKLALTKVSEIRSKVREADIDVRILHWPDKQPNFYNDVSHAGIFDVEAEEDVIALKLSQIKFEMVAAKAS
jgi:hypothetical protein